MTNSTLPIMNLVASALAAIATVVLAFFARRQWNVMEENNKATARQGELLRDRWKRDDEIRADENRPKAVFELNPVANDHHSVNLWCANLGTVSFVVSGIGIEPVHSPEKVILFPKLKHYVLTAGAERTIDLDFDADVLGEYHGNADVRLCLQGPSEKIVTDARPYWLSVIDGKRYGLRAEFHGFEQVTCPKCNRWAANFRAEGISSVADCRKQIAEVEREFEASCRTKHTSSNGRVTFGE